MQAVHPDGEVAVARAAAARGTAVGLSSFGSKPVEEVVAANPQTFFQMYWMGDRDTMVRRMDRARDAGAVGLIVTLDWSFSHGRDWGSPSIPDKIDVRTMARFAPEVARRPRWLLDFARTRRLPDLSVPNVVGRGETPPTFFGAYGEWMQTPPPSWKDVAWLREEWGGPFMVKGISRVDDALAARDAGVTTLSVSNHGGNNIDGTPAPIRVLSSIATAVGHDVEVVMDGGIRRGSDVVKALALGAQGRDDRPRVPLGVGRQRPGRRGERAGHPAQRDRLDAARPRARRHRRDHPRRRARAGRLHPGARPATGMTEERVALVTGAARGIGAATVRELRIARAAGRRRRLLPGRRPRADTVGYAARHAR